MGIFEDCCDCRRITVNVLIFEMIATGNVDVSHIYQCERSPKLS